MERNISLAEVSDGKLYGPNDMVKVGCNDCQGCSKCCGGMGSSITLDPLDIYRLSAKLKQSFEQMLAGFVELNVVDGIILPNIKMAEGKDHCSFLNTEGRCSIHDARPGICRLFPLGRFYENETFRYFLQVHECPKENKTKIKLRKWIDTENLQENERFVTEWHYFLKHFQNQIMAGMDEGRTKEISLYILNHFYIIGYDLTADFYPQFQARLAEAKKVLK